MSYCWSLLTTQAVEHTTAQLTPNRPGQSHRHCGPAGWSACVTMKPTNSLVRTMFSDPLRMLMTNGVDMDDFPESVSSNASGPTLHKSHQRRSQFLPSMPKHGTEHGSPMQCIVPGREHVMEGSEHVVQEWVMTGSTYHYTFHFSPSQVRRNFLACIVQVNRTIVLSGFNIDAEVPKDIVMDMFK